MFVGHFGIAFAAKKIAPQISLGLTFLSAQFLDLLWPTLLQLNIERVEIVPASGNITPLRFTHYPYSHSLLMVLLWSLLFGVIYYAIKKSRKGAFILFLLVLSHWVLDFIVHIPDLPLYPGDSPMMGLGLWKSLIITTIVEGLIFAVGIIYYLRATHAKNNVGKIGFWILVILLSGIYIANFSGPPPPSINMIAIAGQMQWILVLLAFWVDRNRISKIEAP